MFNLFSRRRAISATARALAIDDVVLEIISWMTPFVAVRLACVSRHFYSLTIGHIWRRLRLTDGPRSLFRILPPALITHNEVPIAVDRSHPSIAPRARDLNALLPLVREFVLDPARSTQAIRMIGNERERTRALQARGRDLAVLSWAFPALVRFCYPVALFPNLKRLEIRMDHGAQIPLLAGLMYSSLEEITFDFVRCTSGVSTLRTENVINAIGALLHTAVTLQRLTIKSEVPLIIPNPGYSFIQAINPQTSTLRYYAGTEVFFTDGVFSALARMPRLESVEMLERSWDAGYAVPLLNLGTLHHIASLPATFCALKFAHVIGTADEVEQMLACFHSPLTQAHIHLSEIQAPEELEKIMGRLSRFARTLTSVSMVDATNPDWSPDTPSFDYKANILQFLLPCTSMRAFEFNIETVRQLDLRDVHLEQVARSWPLLEEFTILWGGRDLDYVDQHRVHLPSDLTVHSLALFSIYAPHLRKLQILWLNSIVPIPRPVHCTSRHTAGKLFFRICFEPQWNPRAFAAFLDLLWPDLPIDFDRGSYFCETHRIIETVDRSVRALYELRARTALVRRS